MGVFDKIERSIEGAVSGAFAKAFKGDVQPVEITARIQRELDSEAKLLSRDRKLVPNEFTVSLSQHDYDRLEPYAQATNASIAGELRDYAGKQGYVFSGPIQIHYELAPNLPTGRFTLASEAVAGVEVDPSVAAAEPPRPAATPKRPKLILEVNGTRHALNPPGLSIGRGTEADLRINDPGISRRHAQIIVNETEDGQEILIEDLGSTNGIVVNGARVRKATLTPGSRIEVGTTRMLITTSRR